MTPSPEPRTIEERLMLSYEWTPRQEDVLNLLAKDCSNREIADALGISLDGAKWHLREIFSKLGVESREEAAEYWRRRNGWSSRLSRIFPAALAVGAGRLTAGMAAALVAAGVIVAVAVVVANGNSSVGRDSQGLAPAAMTTAPPGVSGSDDPLASAVQTAVEQGDWAGFVALIDFTPSKCVGPGISPAPRCPAGSPIGYSVPSVARFQCGEAWVSEDELGPPIGATLPARYRLFAISNGGRPLDHLGQSMPVDRWMLFDSPDTREAPAGLAVGLNATGIVAFGMSCGGWDEFVSSITDGGDGWALPPSQ